MPFPEEIVEQAWARSGRFCECESTTHNHFGRCFKMLFWQDRGRDLGGWEAHSVSGQHLNTTMDCRIFCWDCHKATF